MSGRGTPPDGRDPSQPRPAGEGWTGWPVLFPIGMLFGLASSIALIIFRVTRS